MFSAFINLEQESFAWRYL